MGELRIALVALGLFVAMVISARIGRRDRRGIVLLVLLSLVWFGVDNAFEGPVLLRVSEGRGLTTADLVGLAGLAGAAALWRRNRRR